MSAERCPGRPLNPSLCVGRPYPEWCVDRSRHRSYPPPSPSDAEHPIGEVWDTPRADAQARLEAERDMLEQAVGEAIARARIQRFGDRVDEAVRGARYRLENVARAEWEVLIAQLAEAGYIPWDAPCPDLWDGTMCADGASVRSLGVSAYHRPDRSWVDMTGGVCADVDAAAVER